MEKNNIKNYEALNLFFIDAWIQTLNEYDKLISVKFMYTEV
jgi:hypothetical protein